MRLWLVTASLLLIADEILKSFALQYPTIIHKNFGIALDIPIASYIVIPIIAIIVLVAARAFWQHRHDEAIAIPLAFIVAGGLGNLFDRIFYGFIVDYLIIGRSAFNISDLMILGGVIGLIVATRRTEKKV